jgi:hypothetical protein
LASFTLKNCQSPGFVNFEGLMKIESPIEGFGLSVAAETAPADAEAVSASVLQNTLTYSEQVLLSVKHERLWGYENIW